jgi:hypothetical protein
MLKGNENEFFFVFSFNDERADSRGPEDTYLHHIKNIKPKHQLLTSSGRF